MSVNFPASSTSAGEQVELVERLRAGDAQAFETLVRQFGGQMLAVARRYLKCEADSADAVQEAFVSAYRALGSFEANSSLSTWLHRIVVNACLMKLRAKSRHRIVPLDDLLPRFDGTGHHTAPIKPWTDQAHHRLASAETRAQVRACIDCLPEDYRTILLLRDIEEFDTEQTANMLGISTAAVKTRLHRARQALRTLLEPLYCTN
jgi:RNA polymerase sigma-70 factor, ECF subfamily